MSDGIVLKVELRCRHYDGDNGCPATIETVASLSGEVESGGRVEIDVRPAFYPSGWGNNYYGYGPYCPAHRNDHR